MAFQTVFKRYELKYMLTVRQKEMVLRAMHPHTALDQYGRSSIRNIYFDTGNYRLVRRSIESPAYKESCASAATVRLSRMTPCSWS